MSQEIKTPEPDRSQTTPSDEERKRQFERMKDKFSRQNGGPGKGSPNGAGGNNFYWIYGLVVAVLLFIIFYGSDTNSKMVEIPQSKFYQDMLVKGDVQDVAIVNKTLVRIRVNPDSAAALDRYKTQVMARPIFQIAITVVRIFTWPFHR